MIETRIRSPSENDMNIVALIARLLLGLAFTVFGLNGFFHFLPQPPFPTGSPAEQFTGAMATTGYLLVVFAVQLACGLVLLSGFFVPLALVLVAPVIVNILLFHATMAPAGLPPGVIVAVLWCVVAIRYRASFAPLFAAKPQPAATMSSAS